MSKQHERRFGLRRHTYHGVNGWLIYSIGDHQMFRTRIFSQRESEALRMADELRRGEQPRFDFQRP